MNSGVRLRTYFALGPRSLARVGIYRLGLKTGLHPVQRLPEPPPARGPFFRAEKRAGAWPEADHRWLSHAMRFDWHMESLPEGGIPDWLANPFGDHGGAQAQKPWWTIADFAAGDIKGLWELSRFSWLPPLAALALRGEDDGDRLNRWIADWCRVNPPYRGPNWKCGQEASIRVMHLACAALMLDEYRAPLPGLIELVGQHIARIAPTMGYALGQDNNHGTSEAAALFIGGLWLQAAGDGRGAAWAATGRRWLDERAQTLIAPDGSFSQYSVNYHRVMIDSYALAEIWRHRMGAAPWQDETRARLRAASRWLRCLVDAGTGDAPNIGASDGARLLPLTPTGYRDFRPSVQLATALFEDARAFPPGPWDDQLRWFGIPVPSTPADAVDSRSFDDGGWHVLHNARAMLAMRYPRFRYRPAQADALHADLWVDGVNLLRDAGTYSYNDPSRPEGDFVGTACHNSVTFDGRNQMPRLGRFLFGDWIAAERVELAASGDGGSTAAAGYTDAAGNRHWRRLRLSDTGFSCTDELDGGFAGATLRWRLPPGDWTLDGNRLTGQALTLDFAVKGAQGAFTLLAGQEARHYHRTDPVQLLEIAVGGPCTIETTGFF